MTSGAEQGAVWPPPSASPLETALHGPRLHRLPVEPDLEREGVGAQTMRFLGRFMGVLARAGTVGGCRPDWLEVAWFVVRSIPTDGRQCLRESS
jgi:hypothetical protein